MSLGDRIQNGSIYKGMNLRSLSEIHFKGVPLYSIPQGARFRYYSVQQGVWYSFVKHAEHEFPKSFRLLKPEIITYIYDVGIPQSAGHLSIFVCELEIVQVIDIL